jgi:uncharacterized protein YdaU (DUF1376 family)
MADRLPFMPTDIGQLLTTTGHLNHEQQAVYQYLRIHYWEHGELPNDDQKLARIARVSVKRWTTFLRMPMMEFFGPDWARHAVLDAERSRAFARKQQGKDAARTRWTPHVVK